MIEYCDSIFHKGDRLYRKVSGKEFGKVEFVVCPVCYELEIASLNARIKVLQEQALKLRERKGVR